MPTYLKPTYVVPLLVLIQLLLLHYLQHYNASIELCHGKVNELSWGQQSA